MEPSHHKLLALSCPRSGSRYLTKILRNAGVKVGHESFKKDGTVGMFLAVDDYWYPGKHWYGEDESRQGRRHFRFDNLWHFVRDPRKVIPSLASEALPGFIWCWQERHTNLSAGLYPKTLRAMHFWLEWNQRIEQNVITEFFRIEDLDVRWPSLCETLGIAEQPMVKIDKTYGTVETGPRRTMPMGWDEMKSIDAGLTENIQAMAERYGYDIHQEIA